MPLFKIKVLIYVVGGFNAHLSHSNSRSAIHLIWFGEDNDLILSSEELPLQDSYTYVSEAWHATLWLNHCICTDVGQH